MNPETFEAARKATATLSVARAEYAIALRDKTIASFANGSSIGDLLKVFEEERHMLDSTALNIVFDLGWEERRKQMSR